MNLITSSSLSCSCPLKSFSWCSYTSSPSSLTSQGGLSKCWCEPEHAVSCWCWLSLGAWQSSSWWVEITPSSGKLVTDGVRFLGSWELRRTKLNCGLIDNFLCSAEPHKISAICSQHLKRTYVISFTRSRDGLLRSTVEIHSGGKKIDIA